jgi:hypothetical protein
VTVEFDQERYRAGAIDEWYRRSCAVIELLDEQAMIGADYDDDHLSACLWSLQQAARRLDLALRERR